jgi:hypothetical protein
VIEDKGLLSIVHRLVIDEDFRERFVTIPKETLMAELGVSDEVYRNLAALIPVLLAGGLFVLGNGSSPDPGAVSKLTPEYGHW